jgi:hypothetical protein
MREEADYARGGQLCENRPAMREEASYARGGQLCERRPAMREEASMSNRRRARARGERRAGESIGNRSERRGRLDLNRVCRQRRRELDPQRRELDRRH